MRPPFGSSHFTSHSLTEIFFSCALASPEYARVQDSEFSGMLNPMYTGSDYIQSPEFQPQTQTQFQPQGQQPRNPLPHANSFDRLSNSLGGTQFFPQSSS